MSKEYNPARIHLSHPTRLSRFKYKMHSVSDLLTPANIAVVFFILTDFSVLYSRWESIQTASWFVNLTIALGCAVALDLPFNILGGAASKYKKGIIPKKDFLVIASIAIATFVVIYSCCFAFTYLNSTASYSKNDTAMNTVDFDEAEHANLNETDSYDDQIEKKQLIAAAILTAIVPLATSLSSFAIAFYTNNSIRMDLNKAKRCKIEAQEHYRCLQAAITEAHEFIDDNGAQLLLREDDLLHAFIDDTKAQTLIRQQAFLDALSHIVTADGVNRVIEAGADMDKKANKTTTIPNPALRNILGKKYI